MTIQQVLRILWARRRFMLIVLGVAVIGTLGISLLLPKSYVATASVVVNQFSADPVSGNFTQAQSSTDYLGTQVEIIGSHNVAAKVVDKLRLTEIPVVRQQFLEATGGAGSARDWLADSLLNYLDVLPTRDSNVIDISFSNDDPRFAAQMANAFADAYLQTNLELSVDPAKRQAAWYQDQVLQLRKTLEAAQQKLATYQQAHGLVDTENRLDTENTRLTELTSQLVAVQATQADAESRLKQLNGAMTSDKLDELPDIINNPLMQSMKADIARAEGKLADSAARYGSGHPTYIAALAEVNSLKARLNQEMGTVMGSIRQSAQIAQQRVNELQASVNQQKARILELKQGNDEQSVMQQDVDNAQRAYDNAQLRASQVRLQSQADQTTISVLNPAVTPIKPARPRIVLNTVLAFLGGGLLAVAGALLLELFDRRVRGEEDLTDLNGLPVLAQVPHVVR